MPNRTTRIALVLLLALVWFSTLDYRRLVKADEGRYAEIAREMAASGDWVTPRLNGFKYFEKPPLQYWASASAFSLFGENEWTARLWTALTGFLGVLLVYLAGNRAFGPPAGLHAAAVLASCALYVFLGHLASLDMGVTFFLSASILAFLMAQLDGTSERDRKRWMLACWAAMALAVLSKGLIGVALPVAAVAAYALIERDWNLLKRGQLLPGLAVFFALAAPWFVAVSLANAEFPRFFFVQEHFERYFTTAHGRYQPVWYFVPVLALGVMPWLLAALSALWRGWNAQPRARFRPERFLVAWCAVVFVFFSASSSKLPSYILPMLPALALLVAAYLKRADRRWIAAQAALAAAAGLAVLALAGGIERFTEDDLPASLLADYAPWIAASGIALALGAVCALALIVRGRLSASIGALCAGGLLFTQLALTGHESLSEVYSAYHTAERVKPHLRADAPFYVVNTFDHTLPFYLGRTVTMVAYKDELAAPISWEPHKFLSDIEAFARAWRRDREALAMFSPADFERLRSGLALPMEVISVDPRRVVVRKP